MRKYGGKLLIKPSKKSVHAILRENPVAGQGKQSDPAIGADSNAQSSDKGWANYHRCAVAAKAFDRVHFGIWIVYGDGRGDVIPQGQEVGSQDGTG